ncbi:hypothetical protein [Cohnella sp. AR92]|uniref:hypothetical protein n=1 Tax=Cohnella sp. AR92 TaxID=648716 RepID=UPI000F8F56CA|nr:hypothetical protein [Cohnella sp. AR92]RUS42869.1 hypothetical protein ELR57_26045 [Cohnella sp. AR92]
MIDQNIEKRKQYGLRSDRDYVKQTILSKSSIDGELYLSPTENAELESRFAHQKSYLPKIREQIKESLSDSEFGGLFIDQSAGGKVTINVTSDLKNETKETISKAYGQSAQVVFKKVKNSETKLENVHNELFRSIQSLNKTGLDIVSINTDIIHNDIEVGVLNRSPEVEQSLFKKFGDTIRFTEVDEADYQDDGDTTTKVYPIQGGVQIYDETSNLLCSAGFSAKTTASNPSYYVVTAGHCHSETGYDVVYQPEKGVSDFWVVGSAEYANRKYGGSVDAMLIGTSNLAVSNKVYYQPVNPRRQRSSFQVSPLSFA